MALSIYRAILESVRTKIVGLGLRGLDAGNVAVLKTNVSREEVSPGVPGILIAHPFGSVEEFSNVRGVCQKDDVGYPVVITILASDRGDGTGVPGNVGTQDQLKDHDLYLLWREMVRKAFINQALENVETVYTCNWEPRRIVDESEWKRRNLWASSLVLKFWSRETRGNIVSESAPPGLYVDAAGSPYLEG